MSAASTPMWVLTVSKTVVMVTVVMAATTKLAVNTASVILEMSVVMARLLEYRRYQVAWHLVMEVPCHLTPVPSLYTARSLDRFTRDWNIARFRPVVKVRQVGIHFYHKCFYNEEYVNWFSTRFSFSNVFEEKYEDIFGIHQASNLVNPCYLVTSWIYVDCLQNS